MEVEAERSVIKHVLALRKLRYHQVNIDTKTPHIAIRAQTYIPS
jgi:hypothetical protein